MTRHRRGVLAPCEAAGTNRGQEATTLYELGEEDVGWWLLRAGLFSYGWYPAFSAGLRGI
jgi:hypothetical protein